MMLKLFFIAFALIIILPAHADEARTAQAFSKMLPTQKRMFLQQMPKGGDIHNHLDGNTYAESILRWAAEDGLCIQRTPPSLASPPCDEAKGLLPASNAYKNTDLYTAFINSISMRNFVASNNESAHDHFFKTFLLYLLPLPEKRRGDMLAEAVSRLGRQNTYYVELMISPPQIFAAGALGETLAWNGDFAAMQAKLDQAKIGTLAAEASAYIDRMEARKNEFLHCGADDADAGCKVVIRYQMQIIRDVSRDNIFYQIAFATHLIKHDTRVVTLNLVNWEDNPNINKDHDEQLRMVGFFTSKGKDIKVAQHAGELVLGLVPPESLRNHIWLAINEAGASRIGHGIDVFYEDNADALLKKMASEKILVEVGLTSNDIILGVKGERHPFQLYRKYGVPLALMTDDEGVSRSDLTNEYQRAAETYNLDYLDLKQFARNALEYSFLQKDEKARLQKQLEADFQSFEARDWNK